MILNEEEKLIRKELGRIYPQLILNAKKTCGYAFAKHGLDGLAVAIEFFLSKPLEDQVRTFKEGKMENFITFILAVQVKSGTSKFYTQYRKHHENQREIFPDYNYGDKFQILNDAFIDEENEVVACIKCEISKLDPYLKMLVNERALEGKTYTSISETYDINYNTLKKDTQKAILKIKNKCKPLL